MTVIYDALDGFWAVIDDDGNDIVSPFYSEQDAWDWIEAFGDD